MSHSFTQVCTLQYKKTLHFKIKSMATSYVALPYMSASNNSRQLQVTIFEIFNRGIGAVIYDGVSIQQSDFLYFRSGFAFATHYCTWDPGKNIFVTPKILPSISIITTPDLSNVLFDNSMHATTTFIVTGIVS